MIYKGKPIRIVEMSGIRAGRTYKFEVEENKKGYTVLQGKGFYAHIENEFFPKVEKFTYFKIENGMQGDWKYICKATKEEVDEIKVEEKKVKAVKKERKAKAIKETKDKNEVKEFDSLLKTI
jgi:hypothetical protein